jgi:murein endopeptidase
MTHDASLAAAPFPAVNTLLPASGVGYYTYAASRSKQWGRKATIDAIQAIGEAWMRDHPDPPLIGVGNISLRGGGPMPPHSSHRQGVDVDIRPMRQDGKAAPVSIKQSQYSRERTVELVKFIRGNGVLEVVTILFNDASVPGVRPWKGHDNHLHVRFSEG